MSDVGWIEWKCPDCGSPLKESESEIVCASCGRSWPVEQQIPLFLDGSRVWLDGTEWADSLEPFFQDEASDHWLFWSRMRAVLSMIERLFEGRERPRVLDVGCGTGYVLSHLRDRGARTVGVEITPEPLRLAQRRDPQSRFVCAPSDRLPFRDDQFDLAISLDVYEHIEDELPVVKETFRVLAPGGWHLVFVPAHPFLWSRTDRTQGHFRRYDRKALGRLLEQADFEVPASGYLMPSLVAPAFLIRKLNDLLLSEKKGFQASSLEYRLPPRAINRVVCGLLSVERWITLRLGTPFGITAYALARKRG